MTTAAPVFSTALVMKDLFEYRLTSSIFGWDITFIGHVMLTVINEASSSSFWMYFFNFDFLIFSREFIHNLL